VADGFQTFLKSVKQKYPLCIQRRRSSAVAGGLSGIALVRIR